MLFRERSKLAMEVMAKQPPVTLEQAREQVKAIKEQSVSKNKKGHNEIQGTSDKGGGATSEAEASDHRESEGASATSRG